MAYLACNIDDKAERVVTRLLPSAGGAKLQTLLVRQSPKEVIFNADGNGAVCFGPSIKLTGDSEVLAVPNNLVDAVWDPFSSSIILLTTRLVLQLTHDNVVRTLAGQEKERRAKDGVGAAARFSGNTSVTTDGMGALYVADDSRIRKVQLPASFQGTWSHGSTAAHDQVVVTTLPSVEQQENIMQVAYIPGSDSHPSGKSSCLLYSTDSALYRVALTGVEGSNKPMLWVGSQDEAGSVDATGLQARFSDIIGVTVDADGSLYIADFDDGDTTLSVRKVSRGRKVTTIVSDVEGRHDSLLSILPNGYLAMAGNGMITFMDLKLRPSPITASAAPPAPPLPPPRTLPSDLGSLLDRQPDGTADLTLTVGDRTFAVHRGILAARSDYFRQRLEGGFADGSSQQLSLPDADPETFALLLRFIYTGTVDIPSALVRSVAELADRLVLPELCQEALAQVLAEVRPGTVVDRLLWAEARGPSFSRLLADLSAWCVEHRDDVVERAGDSVKRLMTEKPDLAMQLFVVSKRRRVQP